MAEKTGDRYSFNLRVNPVVTKKIEGAANPKSRKWDDIVMETKAKYIREKGKENIPSNNEIVVEAGLKWIGKHSGLNGFSVDDKEVIVEGYQQFQGQKNKGGFKIHLGIMDYSGILTVTDPEKFKAALTNGIGHSKAFGCGMLLIRKL